MNYTILSKTFKLILISISVFLIHLPLEAQPVLPKNISLRYYEVPLKEQAGFEQKWLKEYRSTYQKAIEKERLQAVYLTSVWYPKGKRAKYHFVAIEVFEKFENMDDQLLSKLDQDPQLLKRDIMGVIDMLEANKDTFPLSTMAKGQKLYIDLMKVSNTDSVNAFSNYFSLESNIWKPVHQARMDLKTFHSWAICSTWFNATIDGYYDILAINGLGTLENFMKAGNVQMQDIHTDKDMTKDVWQPTHDARTWLEGQWWEIIEIIK